MIFNVFSKFGNIEEILYEKLHQRVFVKYQNMNQAFIAKEYLNNTLFFDSMVLIYVI
jgi:polypyrimidine tract-binding protein 2